jgi:glutathione S-transferase
VKPTRLPLLVTIGPSHYCEKARWALERAGIAYVEEPHAPMMHWAYTLPRARTRTVPLLLVEGEPPITDSTDILRYADRACRPEERLFPEVPTLLREVERLESRFDEELGPAARRLAYCYVTLDARPFVGLFAPSLPPVERRVFERSERVLRALLRRAFKVSDAAALRTRGKLEALFADVSTLVKDGRRYLVGERLTAADVTFVALAGPVLLPERSEQELDRLPREFASVVRALRATPAGQFALELHARERRGARAGVDA